MNDAWLIHTAKAFNKQDIHSIEYKVYSFFLLVNKLNDYNIFIESEVIKQIDVCIS